MYFVHVTQYIYLCLTAMDLLKKYANHKQSGNLVLIKFKLNRPCMMSFRGCKIRSEHVFFKLVLILSRVQ